MQFHWNRARPIHRLSSLLVVMAGLLALLITMFGVPNRTEAEEEYTEELIANEFTQMIRLESYRMNTWLRLALREEVPCEGPCNRDDDFSRIVETLIIRCNRFDPEIQANSPYYKASQHGRELARLKAACTILSQSAASHGNPSERPEWVQSVTRARANFEK